MMMMMMMAMVIAIRMAENKPEGMDEARDIEDKCQKKIDPELITATSVYEYSKGLQYGSLGAGDLDSNVELFLTLVPMTKHSKRIYFRAMVAPIDAQTSRCRHIVIQDQPPDRVPQMSHLVRSHFHHQSLGNLLSSSINVKVHLTAVHKISSLT
uniref:Cystatin domain-containing protein n=1 Tax=Angiostrongylus cantonensis TaxID=6313 RepID=A0A0K0DQJ0_ANGCA